jgi:RNA polymerase sigma-70 factor, ECF subfamily
MSNARAVSVVSRATIAVPAVTDSDKFVQLLTDCQSRLYAYILSILPDSAAARDVLSETNIKLWRKWQEFETGRDFATWAFRFAYFEVLAFQKRRRTDRHVFDGDLLAELADDAIAVSRDVNERLLALGYCIEKLPARDRSLVSLRYQSQMPVQEIAQKRSKSPNAISHALFRIRSLLAECIERTLNLEGSG